jgi:DNA-binding MarR family transcriptional regulator
MPLARLFAMAFHHFVDGLHERLAEQGWSDVRPSYGFVLLAAREGPTTPGEIARLLGVTKQAASVLVAQMQQIGYLEAAASPGDGRVKAVTLTARAGELLGVVEQIYGELESGWAEVIGRDAVEAVREHVRAALEGTHEGKLPGVRPTW